MKTKLCILFCFIIILLLFSREKVCAKNNLPNAVNCNSIVTKTNKADNKKPIIKISGSKSYNIEKGKAFKIPRVSAKDNRDGNITDKIRVNIKSNIIKGRNKKYIEKRIKKNKSITFNKIGKYVVVYSVKDKAGNKTKRKIYIKVFEPEDNYWVLTQHPDVSGNQAMFYTFYNPNYDSLIVIDGGWKENTEHVRDVINSYGGHVSAWIITHYHNDHVDAFNEILKNRDGIIIDNIYASPMNYDEYLAVAKFWDSSESFANFLEVTKYRKVTYLYTGDEFDVENLHFKVFNSYDPKVSEFGDIPNNASLLFKVIGKETSILFCADCHSPKLADKLVEKWGDELKADYVQTGHHGNNSFPTSFYDFVAPKVALFDAPDWLMEGDNYTAKNLKAHFLTNGVVTYDMMTEPNEFKFR